MSPQTVVQRQLEAYNAHDLERFVAVFSNDIRVYRPPDVAPTIVGREAFAHFYATQRFNRPDLRAEIVNRMVVGNKVIDHERIWGLRELPYEVAVVYEVIDDRIQSTWFYAAQ